MPPPPQHPKSPHLDPPPPAPPIPPPHSPSLNPPQGASGQQLVGGVVGVQNRGVAPPRGQVSGFHRFKQRLCTATVYVVIRLIFFCGKCV